MRDLAQSSISLQAVLEYHGKSRRGQMLCDLMTIWKRKQRAGCHILLYEGASGVLVEAQAIGYKGKGPHANKARKKLNL